MDGRRSADSLACWIPQHQAYRFQKVITLTVQRISHQHLHHSLIRSIPTVTVSSSQRHKTCHSKPHHIHAAPWNAQSPPDYSPRDSRTAPHPIGIPPYNKARLNRRASAATRLPAQDHDSRRQRSFPRTVGSDFSRNTQLCMPTWARGPR